MRINKAEKVKITLSFKVKTSLLSIQLCKCLDLEKNSTDQTLVKFLWVSFGSLMFVDSFSTQVALFVDAFLDPLLQSTKVFNSNISAVL